MRYLIWLLFQPVLIFSPSNNLKFAIWLFTPTNQNSTLTVWSIAMHETAGLTSALYKEHKNCFGMGWYEGQPHAYKVKNGAIGEPWYSAGYSNIFYSVKEFFNYVENHPNTKRYLFEVTYPYQRNFVPISTIEAVVYSMGVAGYFTADIDKYTTSVSRFAGRYTTITWLLIGLLVVYLPALIIIPYWIYIRNRRHR